jgi:hypothetical protein
MTTNQPAAELGFEGDKIRRIRDFRYVQYVMLDAALVLLESVDMN